ncbi:unnamed protein product, partial [Effrenium voratum]
GVTPHASPCTARGPSVRDALNRGHFYVFADKQGTCKIRVGFSGRQRHVESVRAYECAAAFQQKQQEIAGRLELLKRCKIRVGFSGRRRQVEFPCPVKKAARQLSRDDLKLLMDAKEKPEEGVEGFLLWLPGRAAEARGEMPLKRVQFALSVAMAAADSKRLTTQRKRAAGGELRALASELGVQDDNLRLDMTAEQFRRAAGRLVESCATPDQRRQLERAVNRYQNIVVPPLPGRAAENARSQGEEAGVEEVATSGWVPWSDYSVKGWWIDNLWTEHKLRHDVYLDYACKIRVGFSGRQRQVESVRAYECAAAFQQKQQEIAGRLELLKRPFRPDVLEALRPWANQYAELKMRYKFLVLRGGSQTGKSTLAKSLGDAFGWRPPYVQTVQSAPAPDLKEFQREEHGYILFDNVNHMDFVLNERALFQSNNDIHTLGSSRTGIYSYPVWLFQMPLVVTVDLSAEWNSSELWLADNMFEVFLESPCYT